MLTDVCFYNKRPKTKEKISARMKDVTNQPAKAIENLLNLPSALRADKNEEESDNLQNGGMKKIRPSKITDIYTRLETKLGLKLSGHTDILTETSNRMVIYYKRGEIQTITGYEGYI